MTSTNARTRPLPNGLDHSSLPVGVHLPINTAQPPAAINSGAPSGHHVMRGERVSLHRLATSRQRRRMWRRGAAVLGADGGGADAALRLRAAATAHVACQVHASLHLGHPELRRKGQQPRTQIPPQNNNKAAEGIQETPLAICRDVTFSKEKKRKSSN